MASGRPNIFQYLEYRLFLKDCYAHLKSKNPKFSLRSFAALIDPGLSSSGLLPAVLKGKRNLGADLRLKIARALHFNEKEALFFELLVRFNQSDKMAEKNRIFLDLSRFRQSKARTIHGGHYKLFSKWYFPVLWNYFGTSRKQGNPFDIGQSIRPNLSAKQVEEGIHLLLSLNLIKRTANGYKVSENHLATENEFLGLTAMQYNREFLRMAFHALEDLEPEHRLFTTLVFSLAKDDIDQIKERIQSFKEEVKAIIDRSTAADQIYTLTLQLYPNTIPDGIN